MIRGKSLFEDIKLVKILTACNYHLVALKMILLYELNITN